MLNAWQQVCKHKTIGNIRHFTKLIDTKASKSIFKDKLATPNLKTFAATIQQESNWDLFHSHRQIKH